MIYGNETEPKYMEFITDSEILDCMSQFKFEAIQSFDKTKIYTYEIGSEHSEVIMFSHILRGLFPYACKLLQQLSRRYRVITWESRGTPEYNFPDNSGGLSMESHARDLNAVAQTKSVKDAHVVCWCSGSCTGIWTISTAVFNVTSLVLLAPPIRADHNEELCEFDKTIMRSHESILSQDERTIKWLTRVILKGLEQKRPNRPYWEPFDLPKLHYSNYASSLANLTIISNMLYANHRTVELLLQHCQQLPVMLLFSTDDEFIRYKNGISLVQELKNAKLIIYSNGGHGFVSANIPRCADEILNYLKHI